MDSGKVLTREDLCDIWMNVLGETYKDKRTHEQWFKEALIFIFEKPQDEELLSNLQEQYKRLILHEHSNRNTNPKQSRFTRALPANPYDSNGSVHVDSSDR
jgi:hypothetical protein